MQWFEDTLFASDVFKLENQLNRRLQSIHNKKGGEHVFPMA